MALVKKSQNVSYPVTTGKPASKTGERFFYLNLSSYLSSTHPPGGSGEFSREFPYWDLGEE